MSRGEIAIAILIGAGCVGSAPGQSTASVLEVELRNAGANKWTSIGPEGGVIQALSVDPHNPRTLYAATGYNPWSGLGVAFKTTDGGAHWAPSGGPNKPLVFDPQDLKTIYAFDSISGISKSTDGGTSWKPANSGLPPEGVHPPQVIVLAIDPLNPFTLYAGTSPGIFKSTDAGTSWSSAGSGLPLGYECCVVIDPQNPSTLYAVVNAPGRSVFKSTDGGGNWNPAGLGESLVYNLAIDPQHPSTLYAGTNQGVFKTTDGGTSWTPVNSGLPPFPLPRFWTISSMVIDPLTPGTVYVAIDNLSGGRVFKSMNGGGSWSDSSSGLPEGLRWGLVNPVLQIDPQIPTTLYAGTNAGVFKSTDGGTSWAAVNSGLTAISIYDVAVDPQNSGTLYAATFEGLVKTTDGGATWNSGVSWVGSPLAIDPQNTSTVFASGCAAASVCGVAKSTNGGTSWTVSSILHFYDEITSDSITAIAIDPQNSNAVYATTQGPDYCAMDTLYKSVDGGASWSDSRFKDVGVLASCLVALVVDPQNSGNLYAAFQYGGVFKSTDAGATWNAANSGLSPGTAGPGPTPLGTGSPFYSAVALAIDPSSPSTVYTASFSGIFKSSDGGMSWNPVNAGLPNDCCFWPRLAVDPQNSARVYLGIALDGAQRVFQSSDGGASWVDSGLAVYSYRPSFVGLTISSQGPSTVYAGTSGAGVFALRQVEMGLVLEKP